MTPIVLGFCVEALINYTFNLETSWATLNIEQSQVARHSCYASRIFSSGSQDMATALVMDPLKTDEDKQLVSSDSILQRVSQGDKSAVQDCITTYGPMIWSLSKRLCGVQDAEDATQDIFIEIWQHAGKFDPDRASESTFVTMIARRRLIDRLRRRPTDRAIEAGSVEIEELVLEPELADRLEVAEEAQKATRCLNKLNEMQRKVILLSIHHGLSHSNIAKQLGSPLGTIKSYARRALIQLRDCMRRPQASARGES